MAIQDRGAEPLNPIPPGVIVYRAGVRTTETLKALIAPNALSGANTFWTPATLLICTNRTLNVPLVYFQRLSRPERSVDSVFAAVQ